MPAGFSYSDRGREKNGDYARLAFMSFQTLVLEIERDCPKWLIPIITEQAATIQARRGEQYQVSACGQTVRLGG
jgi:hypothetical protein